MPSFDRILAVALVVFLGIGLHEFAHAKAADNAGDPTPRMYGRVTLNLTKHFDLFGTIMMVMTAITGFGIGWGKPVPMDPSKMKNPRWDHFLAVLAGPFANVVQATCYAIVLRVLLLTHSPLIRIEFVFLFLTMGVVLNLSLCFFNLIPIGPLDGMWLVSAFLKDPARLKWVRWNLMAGQFVFLGLVLLGQARPEFSFIRFVIGPPVETLFKILIGVPFR